MSFKGGISNAQIAFNQMPASGVFGGTTLPIPNQRIQSYFQSGTSADQLDGLAVLILTLTASTPQTINLLTGLTDVLGNALTVARINFIAFKNLSQVDGANILVGDAVTNEFDGFLTAAAKLTIFPSSPGNDGYVMISAPNSTGMPVSSTNCQLKIDPGTTANQLVMIVGTRSV